MKHLFIAFTAAGFLVACSPKTTEIIEVTETVEETTSSTNGDMPKADIGEGKVVFLKNCLTCHYGNGPSSAETIDNFSKKQFENILPKMIKNAELNTEQSRQVKAYIFWELEN
ncbi:MAG: hypothetical protein HRT58_16970 [Crocinitomicaceae bacterium]|nr:hypothetical protein [Flavobacteriales bacterium]NQZ37361.1 hypothetical protein [Crocinitomicaceae bacterium]PHR22561.1 MAG: hypothetical protein COA38_17835 [Fluviicola sp.]